MGDKESLANSLHLAVQNIQHDFADGEDIIGKVEAQMGEFPGKMAQLEKDTMSMACCLRKSIIRIMSVNTNDMQTVEDIKHACMDVKNLLNSFNWDIGNDIHVISSIVSRAHDLFDLFRQVGDKMVRTLNILKQVKTCVIDWANELKNTAREFFDALEEDFHELEHCVQRICLQVMLVARSLVRMVPCPGSDGLHGSVKSSLREGLLLEERTTLEELAETSEKLKQLVEVTIVGQDGMSTIQSIEGECLRLKDQLQGMYKDVMGWYHELTRPADCTDVATLGIDRIVDATGLAIVTIKGLCNMPGLMDEARDIVNNGTELLPQIKTHWDEIWEHFVGTTRKLCDHLWIEFAPGFADPETGADAVFSWKHRSFLNECEHRLLNSSCPCIAGAAKAYRSAKKTGMRFYERKCLQIKHLHLQRPKTDYLQLVDQFRASLAPQ